MTWSVTWSEKVSFTRFTQYLLLFSASHSYLFPRLLTQKSLLGLTLSGVPLFKTLPLPISAGKGENSGFQSPLPFPLFAPFQSPVVKGNRQVRQDAAQFLPEAKCYAEATSLSREMNACTRKHISPTLGFRDRIEIVAKSSLKGVQPMHNPSQKSFDFPSPILNSGICYMHPCKLWLRKGGH